MTVEVERLPDRLPSREVERTCMPEVIRYLKHERRHNSSLIVDPAVLAMYLQMQWHRVSLVDGGREQYGRRLNSSLRGYGRWIPPLLPPCIGAWVTAGPGGGMGGSARRAVHVQASLLRMLSFESVRRCSFHLPRRDHDEP